MPEARNTNSSRNQQKRRSHFTLHREGHSKLNNQRLRTIETESSSIDSKVPFPIRSNKKRKPLKHLTTEHHHFRETPKEGRTDTLKETEEIYDERGNQDVIVDVHTSEVYNEPPQDTEALDSNEVYTENTHSLIPDTNLNTENTDPLIPDFTVNTDNTDPLIPDTPANKENTVPLIYNATYNIPESDSLEQNLDTGHSENMKSLGIEKYDLAEKSEDQWLLSDEFFKQTKKIINHENGLKEITKVVHKVKNELDSLSKLHSEIKDNLMVKWAAKSIQPSSSSDSISEGNVSLKDDTDDDSCIPMRNAENVEQTRSLKGEKKKAFELKVSNPRIEKMDEYGGLYRQLVLVEMKHLMKWLYSKKGISQTHLPDHGDVKSETVDGLDNVHLRSKPLATQCKSEPYGMESEPSEIQSKRPRLQSDPSVLDYKHDAVKSIPAKPPRLSLPIKLGAREDQLKREEYKIFLEEQNYRAIQMVESRLSRVEEKLDDLQSITLDIRNLLLNKAAEYTSSSGVPSGDAKFSKAPTGPPLPPPPPPLPPPPSSSEVFFYSLRSSTSHNSSLNGPRRRGSPRNKSLRPAITVDDLRSVTLRKVAKEQQMKGLTATYATHKTNPR